MSQPSVYFAAGRVAMLRGQLLNASRLDRLLSAPNCEEALHILSELGWTSAEPLDYEQLASERVRRASREVRALSTNPTVTDCFLYHYDVANLKMLYKARLLGIEAAGLSDCGVYPVEKLRHAVNDHRYTDLPAPLRTAMKQLEQDSLFGVDPMRVDVALDQALYTLVTEKLKDTRCKSAKEYFRARADLLNAITLLRVRKMRRDAAFFLSILLPGGKIDQRTWKRLFEHPEELAHAVHDYGRSVEEAARKASVDFQHLPALEKAMDDYLLAQFSSGANTVGESMLPSYLLRVQREAAAVRLILAGKKNGFSADKLRERLRDV